MAVQVHVRLPVDPVEVQPYPSPFFYGRRREFVPVPEIGIEKRLRDRQLIVAEVRIRDRPGIQIAYKDGTRDGGNKPIGGVESGRRDGLTGSRDRRFALDPPA